jgi:hypothetical protein
MRSPVVYVYSLVIRDGSPASAVPALFTWPNPCRKYIRDTYTVNGELRLPPDGRLALTRHKVNPKAGQRLTGEVLDIGEFLAG